MFRLKTKFKYLGYLLLLSAVIFEYFKDDFPENMHKGFFSIAIGLLIIYLSAEKKFYDLKNKIFFKSFIFCWLVFYLVIFIFDYRFSTPEFIICLFIISEILFQASLFFNINVRKTI